MTTELGMYGVNPNANIGYFYTIEYFQEAHSVEIKPIKIQTDAGFLSQGFFKDFG